MAAVSRTGSLRPALCCLAAALAACAPAAAKGPDASALPPDLLFTLALGPASTLRGLQAYVEAIKPGAGAVISEQIIRSQLAAAAGVPSLDGLDASEWTYVMVGEANGAPAVAIAGKVRDAKALTAAAGADHLTIKNGWAVVGNRINVDRDAAFAFATLVTQPTPKLPTATIYLPQILSRYQQHLSELRTQVTAGMGQTAGPMKAMMNAYVDGIASIGDDTDRVILTLDAAPDLASLDLALVPRAKSRLAAFVAAQKPTDYALLSKLPAQQPSMLMAGRFDLGPYHDAMMSMMSVLFDPSGSKELLAAMEQLRKTMTGDMAAGIQFSSGAGMQMTQLFGTTDNKVADQSLANMLDLFKTGRTIEVDGAKTTIKATATPTTYAGVTIRGYDTSMDLTKASAAQRQISTKMGTDKPQHARVAAFDKLAMVLLAPEPDAGAQQVIDTARGKGTPYVPSPQMKAQLDASRARKDSFAMIIDVDKFLSMIGTATSVGTQPIVMSLGSADHNAHLRFALPAATLRGLASMKP